MPIELVDTERPTRTTNLSVVINCASFTPVRHACQRRHVDAAPAVYGRKSVLPDNSEYNNTNHFQIQTFLVLKTSDRRECTAWFFNRGTIVRNRQGCEFSQVRQPGLERRDDDNDSIGLTHVSAKRSSRGSEAVDQMLVCLPKKVPTPNLHNDVGGQLESNNLRKCALMLTCCVR
ncbi:hypothetical protein EX30DRAFT_339713 [Ascodesmis nigricans]|uniref:Uncharacterized protein n=1 Tax=Ascodesmis nigricans TaxID=341454 RepID=A0A4S2N0F0_9PEZI|nr:hypothetical protein EX30DRAFT_339713 [Ascodesmis nigricans]